MSGVSPFLMRRLEGNLWPLMRWGGRQGAGALAPGGQECLEGVMAVVSMEMLRGSLSPCEVLLALESFWFVGL